MRDRGARG